MAGPSLREAQRRSFLVALVGQGVKPSLTPEMHEREAWRQGIRYVYKTVDLASGDAEPQYLRRLLEFAVRLGFDGLNVTHPVKQSMLPLLDEVSPDVAAIGALNTVLVHEGRTFGHNTDVSGFQRAFRDGLPDVALDQVVVLGAGGAGTAIAHALVRLGVGRLVLVDPEPQRLAAIVPSVRRVPDPPDVTAVPPSELDPLLAGASGLVNATPVGMAAHPGTPLPTDLLHPTLWVADIVYRPLVTDLLRAAGARGCRTLSGAGMAVHQAADAFELITGRPADRDAMSADFDQMVAAELDLSTPTASARKAHGERNS